jgi:hypothetical protein
MKKQIAAGALVLTVLSGAAYGFYGHIEHQKQYMLSEEKNLRPAEVLEGEQEGKKGVTFVMNLCVPMPAPAACDKRKFGIFVPYGTEAKGMPYEKRAIDVESVEEARIEAEARADMIENVKRQDQ